MSWFRYSTTSLPNPGRRILTVCVAEDTERIEVEQEIGKRQFERLSIWAGDMPNLDFLAECLPEGPPSLIISGGVASLSGIDKLVRLVDFHCDLTSDKPLPTFGTLVNLEKCQLSWDKAYDAKSFEHGLFTLPKLRDLTLRFWSRPDCEQIACLGALQALDLRQGSVASLNGLQNCQTLTSLSLAYLSKLKDFSAIAGHRGLQTIELANCPAFDDVTILGTVPNLRNLRLEKIPAQVENLKWMAGLQKLESILVGNIQELDWTILFSLPALKSIALGTHAGYSVPDAEIFALAKAAGRNLRDFRRIGTKKVPAFTMDLE